jgi:hypothetical protein
MGVLFIFLLVFLASAIVDTKKFINKINYLSLIIVDANIIFYFFSFVVVFALVDAIFNDLLKIKIKLRSDVASI